jgi:hypothetical protein
VLGVDHRGADDPVRRRRIRLSSAGCAGGRSPSSRPAGAHLPPGEPPLRPDAEVQLPDRASGRSLAANARAASPPLRPRLRPRRGPSARPAGGGSRGCAPPPGSSPGPRGPRLGRPRFRAHAKAPSRRSKLLVADPGAFQADRHRPGPLLEGEAVVLGLDPDPAEGGIRVHLLQRGRAPRRVRPQVVVSPPAQVVGHRAPGGPGQLLRRPGPGARPCPPAAPAGRPGGGRARHRSGSSSMARSKLSLALRSQAGKAPAGAPWWKR